MTRFPYVPAILAVLLGLVLMACTVMTSQPTRTAAGCAGTLGNYSLAKTVMTIKVTETIDSKGIVKERETKLTPERVRDGSPVCLEYGNSALAADKVNIVTTKTVNGGTVVNTGMLQAATTKSTDFTGVVIRRFVQAILIHKTGDADIDTRTANAGATRQETAAELTFDPLDPTDMARVNADLRALGLCLVVRGYSYDTTSITPATYCNDAVGSVQRAPSTAPELTREQQIFETSMPGLLYRPRLDYRIALYDTGTPSAPGKWRLVKSENFAAENLSPVLSIGLPRPLFAQRRTAMIFDDGALQTICTTKTSEATELFKIPIEIARGIVRVPAAIVKIDISENQDRVGLLNAQRDLILLQNKKLRGEPLGQPGSFEEAKAGIQLPALTSGTVTDSVIISNDGNLNKLCTENPGGI